MFSVLRVILDTDTDFAAIFQSTLYDIFYTSHDIFCPSMMGSPKPYPSPHSSRQEFSSASWEPHSFGSSDTCVKLQKNPNKNSCVTLCPSRACLCASACRLPATPTTALLPCFDLSGRHLGCTHRTSARTRTRTHRLCRNVVTLLL